MRRYTNILGAFLLGKKTTIKMKKPFPIPMIVLFKIKCINHMYMRSVLICLCCICSLSLLAQPVSYSVNPAPPVIAQVKDNGCWATAYAMMASWKKKKKLGIEEAVKEVSPVWEMLYLADNGMLSAEKNNFIKDAGLKAEGPQNFTIKGWESLLKNSGPLWVTTDETPNDKSAAIHARVLISINGDGTPGNTTMTFIDPQGGKTTEKFSDFIQKFESEVKRIYKKLKGKDWPSNLQLRIQVIHW
jgi:hypothetical protein